MQIGEGEEQVTDLMPLYNGKAMDFDELQGLVQSGEMEESYWNKMREVYFQYMDDRATHEIISVIFCCRSCKLATL